MLPNPAERLTRTSILVYEPIDLWRAMDARLLISGRKANHGQER
ncbi:hypothetical protein SAMN05216452_2149 [Nitratireductor aquibiodomus]|uniref:Uncharacterized protein n=1 Tax=Nitratireductor aquibiodomus TaxID=204799 RepID=A0A1H4KD02_9HYPH|nr:hypothetical protein SAMN05216452_2149 [Nitratireductor aquibiodomus]